VGHGRGVLVALIKGQETLPAYCANEEGKRVARSSGDKKPASAKRASREQASLPVLDKNGRIIRGEIKNETIGSKKEIAKKVYLL